MNSPDMESVLAAQASGFADIVRGSGELDDDQVGFVIGALTSATEQALELSDESLESANTIGPEQIIGDPSIALMFDFFTERARGRVSHSGYGKFGPFVGHGDAIEGVLEGARAGFMPEGTVARNLEAVRPWAARAIKDNLGLDLRQGPRFVKLSDSEFSDGSVAIYGVIFHNDAALGRPDASITWALEIAKHPEVCQAFDDNPALVVDAFQAIRKQIETDRMPIVEVGRHDNLPWTSIDDALRFRDEDLELIEASRNQPDAWLEYDEADYR